MYSPTFLENPTKAGIDHVSVSAGQFLVNLGYTCDVLVCPTFLNLACSVLGITTQFTFSQSDDSFSIRYHKLATSVVEKKIVFKGQQSNIYLRAILSPVLLKLCVYPYRGLPCQPSVKSTESLMLINAFAPKRNQQFGRSSTLVQITAQSNF